MASQIIFFLRTQLLSTAIVLFTNTEQRLFKKKNNLKAWNKYHFSIPSRILSENNDAVTFDKCYFSWWKRFIDIYSYAGHVKKCL